MSTDCDDRSTREVRLPASPESAGSARRFLDRVLTSWATPGPVVEVATLLVSELAGNAVRHGRGAVTVTARRWPRLLRVSVHDDSSVMPATRAPAPDSEHGRGMVLVEALSRRWGAETVPGDGKDVWFELDVAPEDARVER
ncbi:histidine kinase-like protein [Motilibacter peucedani]|uniref:Histidine kinase-like protein n=1 Tax=Motilibacter peucedani TaxID=598650 RepID=A0A420XUD8_9ACTN|nr:ATP-binding protein [Motilibacter peucedani]RKS80370.1 histidine kinase-like protein [Motilibacter peucedani]